jgi:FkbM family methyltransferase
MLTKLDLRNIFPYEKALGESIGSLDLFDHQDQDGSTHASLFPGVISEIHHDTSIAHRVEVDTLENVLASLGIAHIDFLKVDTEGAELAVLRGGKPLLEQNRVDVIQFEFNEMNVISRSFFYDFRTLLRGYNLFRLLPKGLLPIPESPMITELFAFQNIVAISPNVLSLL